MSTASFPTWPVSFPLLSLKGQHWSHCVCTSLALVDVRKFQNRRVKLSVPRKAKPPLTSEEYLREGRKFTMRRGVGRCGPSQSKIKGRFWKLKQFILFSTSCFSVSTRDREGNGHKCFCRDISKSKHSKTVTQGSCHILLHSRYFPRLAHHVLWKQHTRKGKDGVTLEPSSSPSLCAWNGCKEFWDGVRSFCHFGEANLQVCLKPEAQTVQLWRHNRPLETACVYV